MPHFPDNPLDKLAIKPGDADAELDLGGEDVDSALARLDELLAAPRGNAHSYCIRFDPPAGDGRETLFQPVGRHLLAARRAGRIASCLPLSDGTGYVILLDDQLG